MYRDIAISWILYSIREIIGLTKVRNEILSKKLSNYDDIYYGKTFTMGDMYQDIYDLIDDFGTSNKRYLIFTSNGEVRHSRNKKTKVVESHYVSFILDKKNMDIIIIDPSRNNGNMGIYNPYIAICLLPYFKISGYKITWLEMTSPCQTNYHDVFCQSWTLFLIYKYMKSSSCAHKTIDIPKKQSNKYKILLKYFKNLLNFQIFRKELQIQYLENIKYHEDFKFLKEYDPCELLSDMNPIDMNG
jgi:hypothetical protein